MFFIIDIPQHKYFCKISKPPVYKVNIIFCSNKLSEGFYYGERNCIYAALIT